MEGEGGGAIMKEYGSWILLESDIMNSLQSELVDGQDSISMLG